MACLCKQGEHSASCVVDACLSALHAAVANRCALAGEHCRDIRESCVCRIRGFRRYECCFTGKEAVKWLVDNHKASTPEEAVMLGNDMARAGLLHHVSFKRPFQNRKSFYRSLAQCFTSCEISTMRVKTLLCSLAC